MLKHLINIFPLPFLRQPNITHSKVSPDLCHGQFAPHFLARPHPKLDVHAWLRAPMNHPTQPAWQRHRPEQDPSLARKLLQESRPAVQPQVNLSTQRIGGQGVVAKKWNCQSGKRTNRQTTYLHPRGIKDILHVQKRKLEVHVQKRKLEVQYKNVVSGCPKKWQMPPPRVFKPQRFECWVLFF